MILGNRPALVVFGMKTNDTARTRPRESHRNSAMSWDLKY